MSKKQIESAGLVYFHICGCVSEEGEVYLETIDSYRYFASGFYEKVKDRISDKMQDDDVVHIMGVVGVREKVNAIGHTTRLGIINNAKRIIEGKRLKKKENIFDAYGNAFYQLVQEFFYEEIGNFPYGDMISNDDRSLYFVFGGDSDNEYKGQVANALLSLWIEKEEPFMFGKQVLIRSYFMRDLVDRKVVACIPDRDSIAWSIIFEGGINVSLDSEQSYSKALTSLKELGFWSISGVSNILMEPAYSLGKIYYPQELCVEWHKVFLFLCAMQETEWDIKYFCAVYEKFLTLLEKNICIVDEVSPIIAKEDGLKALLIEIKTIKGFLKGEDEAVISKDLLQTLSSRYVYIPYLTDLLSKSKNDINTFSEKQLKNRIILASENKNAYEKGLLWEDVAAYVIEHIAGWKITGRRIKAGHQEIDISVANVSSDDRLWELGAYILVECKNYKKHVEVSQIRNIAYISNMKGNKTALLFAANGITEDARKEIERLAVNHMYILCIEEKDLLEISKEDDCTNLILNKWQELLRKVENELPI